MRYALASAIFCVVAAPAITFAQRGEASPLVNPFDAAPASGGVSANIGDGGGRPITRAPVEDSRDSSSRFALPKLTLPKLPKLQMPKLQMPKLPTMTRREPRTTQPPRTTRSRSEPSSWDKFNTGTKRFFAKTKDTLMPWTADDSATSRQRRPPTGLNRVASGRSRAGSSRSRTEDKPSILSALLPDKKPEEERVESTTDFLKLPRPY